MFKKLFAILLALLMLCACGGGETSMKLLPLEMKLKSASESTVVVSVKNLGENRIEIVDGASLYKTENGKEYMESLIKHLKIDLITNTCNAIHV